MTSPFAPPGSGSVQPVERQCAPADPSPRGHSMSDETGSLDIPLTFVGVAPNGTMGLGAVGVITSPDVVHPPFSCAHLEGPRPSADGQLPYKG